MRKPSPALPGSLYRHPLHGFQKLMPRRVRHLLLVASRYDSFLLGEDERFNDLTLSEFLNLTLGHRPWLSRISNAHKALAAVENRPFDLVVMTPHIRGMDPLDLAREIQRLKPGLPVVPLAFDDRELDHFRSVDGEGLFEAPYVWQGNDRLLLAIMQSMEDRWNVAHDTGRVSVSVVILIEDNEHFYSSYLPLLYAELLEQSQRAITEGFNLQNKMMRLRARPKILHCTTFEQAVECFQKYKRFLLGVISDVRFPREGRMDPEAGLEFAKVVRRDKPDLPFLLQTNDPGLRKRAAALRADILRKHSPVLLRRLSKFIRTNFGFGDFVFRMADGAEVGRVSDLPSLRNIIEDVPDEAVLFHARRNHFSTWLRARTEFHLAEDLRGHRADEFQTVPELKSFIRRSLDDFLRDRQGNVVAPFQEDQFWLETTFARIGEGSLGGKARGLAFIRSLLTNYRIRQRFEDVEVMVPGGAVLTTEVFEQFMEDNRLRDFALQEQDDKTILQRFLKARFREEVFHKLNQFLDRVKTPLAIRSSSLLEDSQGVPFTGVYHTYMVPNHHADRYIRLKQLMGAIKRVYASTFSRAAKEYIEPTQYRLEEEKMAVILQSLVGAKHGRRFYPDLSGVGRSYNFYPVDPMKPDDGVVSLALGLGEAVVSGGRAVSFCPCYPKHPLGMNTTRSLLANTQREFYALDLENPDQDDPAAVHELIRCSLDEARQDGTLAFVGSTYDRNSNAVYDGIGRPGIPLVSFAPILKHDLLPLPEVCRMLLEIGSRAMNRPVEIEFALQVARRPGERSRFAFLQMRPFVVSQEGQVIDLDEYPREQLVAASDQVLGGGKEDNIRDVVLVSRKEFDRSRSTEVARIVGKLNAELVQEGRPYLLVGVGRWGASDPWLGIPVAWEQISGARAIVESDLKDIEVAPSQGSHFFQNLTAAGVGYFTVSSKAGTPGFVDWDWLEGQEGREVMPGVRHLRFEEPVTVLMDGRHGRGVIFRPGQRPTRPGED